MDVVTCKCAQCNTKLASFVNLWIKIGQKYLTPVAQIEDAASVRVSTTGTPREGGQGTLVGGCLLQDAECAKCRCEIGQKCLKTPANHVFNEGQLVFRITSITLKSTGNSRGQVEPKIDRVLSLKNDSGSAQGANRDEPHGTEEESNGFAHQHGPSAETVGFLHFQADLDAQREDIHRIGNTGLQMLSNFETTVAGVEKQMQQFRDTFQGFREESTEQREEIKSLRCDFTDLRWASANKSLVERLDQQLQTTDRVVTELRQALEKSRVEAADLRGQLSVLEHQLAEVKDHSARIDTDLTATKEKSDETMTACREHRTEYATLRREIKQLRAELAKERSRLQARESAPYPSHELEILTNSISKIGNRASQVESLQMEFELFRTRMRRLEARNTTAEETPSRKRPLADADADRHDDEEFTFTSRNARKQRTLGAINYCPPLDSPPKRMVMSPPSIGATSPLELRRAGDSYRSPPSTSAVEELTGLKKTRVATTTSNVRARRTPARRKG